MSLEAEVMELRELIKRQALVINDMQARNLYLEEQLKMNSRNSSKPPSSDRFNHIEPFYNGWAYGLRYDKSRIRISEWADVELI